jgi:hypothetical protein
MEDTMQFLWYTLGACSAVGVTCGSLYLTFYEIAQLIPAGPYG